MSIEKMLIDELVMQSARREVAERRLSEAIPRLDSLNRIQRERDDLDAKWRALRDRTNTADPKITAMYQATQALILELSRRKVSSVDIRNARMVLVEACREAFPHVDLIPF